MKESYRLPFWTSHSYRIQFARLLKSFVTNFPGPLYDMSKVFRFKERENGVEKIVQLKDKKLYAFVEENDSTFINRKQAVLNRCIEYIFEDAIQGFQDICFD